jgi:hypothetical protein
LYIINIELKKIAIIVFESEKVHENITNKSTKIFHAQIVNLKIRLNNYNEDDSLEEISIEQF